MQIVQDQKGVLDALLIKNYIWQWSFTKLIEAERRIYASINVSPSFQMMKNENVNREISPRMLGTKPLSESMLEYC